MTTDEWRYVHGVGPEPAQVAPAPARYHPREQVWIIPDEDMVFVTDTTKTGLDTWDF